MPVEAGLSNLPNSTQPQQPIYKNVDQMTVLSPEISIKSIPSMAVTVTPNRPATRPHRSPPRNSDGDIICTHPDCRQDDQKQPIFKRLCEYNKHMDKHERPYKCSNPACRKNPGFTYAGGLLRHQREVHGMHRTKDPFFCPHSSCNRSSGPGFSRRENLDEHLRRRHSGVNIDDDNLTSTTTITPPTKHTLAPKPFSPHLPRLEPLPPTRKRRLTETSSPDTRIDNVNSGSDPPAHDLHTRLIHLQQDNDRMRTQIFHQDQHITELSQEIKRLRNMLAVSVHHSGVSVTALPPLSSHPVYHHHHQPMT